MTPLKSWWLFVSFFCDRLQLSGRKTLYWNRTQYDECFHSGFGHNWKNILPRKLFPCLIFVFICSVVLLASAHVSNTPCLLLSVLVLLLLNCPKKYLYKISCLTFVFLCYHSACRLGVVSETACLLLPILVVLLLAKKYLKIVSCVIFVFLCSEAFLISTRLWNALFTSSICFSFVINLQKVSEKF